MEDDAAAPASRRRRPRRSTRPLPAPAVRVPRASALSDYWQVPGARIFGGDPTRGRDKVDADVAKVGLHLSTSACRLGYVIVFEECDWGFEESYAAEAVAKYGCRVRFIRGDSAG